MNIILLEYQAIGTLSGRGGQATRQYRVLNVIGNAAGQVFGVQRWPGRMAE